MQLTESEFVRLRDYMYSNFGINLAQKKTLIEGRLMGVVAEKGFSSFNDYIDNLIADKSGAEVSTVVSKLTTNFTYFMREEQHFNFMRDVVLPQVLPTLHDKNLAVWSAACSSGEEPYTIAMVLDDYFKGNKRGVDTRILATDISDRVLNHAKQGIYTSDRMNKLPESWIKRYFNKIGPDSYQVKPFIKSEVIFRKFNLMDPFHFKRKFHLIFCRNVMIYFDGPTRHRLTQKLYDQLVPGGYMFIGMSESLVSSNKSFTYVKPSIYRREK